MKIRFCVLAAALGAVIGDVRAAESQAMAENTAVEPSRARFLRGVFAHHFARQASEFARVAPAMAQAMEALCQSPSSRTLGEARAAWIDTMLLWEVVDAIEIGPLLERRSTYRIDFWPARSHEIESVTRNPPSTVALLDRINAPAKGLPALEWLLWSQPHTPPVMTASNNCAYAYLLAQGVVHEATQLDVAFQALSTRDLTDENADELFSSLINQTFGGIELLRGKHMLKPATLNQGKYFRHVLSGQTSNAWLARWSSIRKLLVGDDEERSTNLNAYLRMQGSAGVANKLRAATQEASMVIQQISRATPTAAEAASGALASVETTLGNDVATALNVTIGFHAYDGD